MLKLVAVVFCILFAELSFGRSIGDDVNRMDVESSNVDAHFTDEEIRLALKFLETAPKLTVEDEIKTLMVDLCITMNQNPMTPDELDFIAKSPQDSRLAGHATQFWGIEFSPHAITNANIITLKRMCADIAKYIPK